MSEMSAAEAAIVARFEAGEPAPESWRGDDASRERARIRVVLDVSPQLVDEDGNLRGYLVSAALAGALLGEGRDTDLHKALDALADPC